MPRGWEITAFKTVTLHYGTRHGWYYNLSDQRWEWQRPRLFKYYPKICCRWFSHCPIVIADAGGGAGAHVWVPRERGCADAIWSLGITMVSSVKGQKKKKVPGS